MYSGYSPPTSRKGNSSTNEDGTLENAFCSIAYKAIIYSVNSKDSRQDSISKRTPKH